MTLNIEVIYKSINFSNFCEILLQNESDAIATFNMSGVRSENVVVISWMRSIRADLSMGVPSILSRCTRSTIQEHPTDLEVLSTSRIIRAGPNQWHREKSNRSLLFPAAAEEEEEEEEVLEFHVKTSFTVCPVWQRRWSIHR